MRVAALYDVHGNLPALEAVLAEAEREADLFVVGGDVTGGAFPREVVDRLRAYGDRALWLRGNLERELVETTEEREGGPPLETLARLRETLSQEVVDFLYALPAQQRVEIDGLGSVLFCHATPWNDLDIVTPLTSDERVERILEGVDADLVVAGHTHMQDRRARWLNAGSVGMPYEDDDGAFWALLGPAIELRRTEYDRSSLAGHDYPQATRREAAEYFETLVHE